MRTGLCINQLRHDSHLRACLANRTLEQIANSQFAPDLFHIDRMALVGEARIAGDDKEPRDPGQRGDDLLDHSVDKIFLLRVTAHVLERQHRDRWLVWEGYGLSGTGYFVAFAGSNAIDAHRPSNVL